MLSVILVASMGLVLILTVTYSLLRVVGSPGCIKALFTGCSDTLWHYMRSRSILNFCFAINAPSIIRNKYERLKHTTFELIRSNGKILVLPASVLDELVALPPTTASPHGALEHDLLGHYTGLDIILENRIHHKIIQRRLTPRLPLLITELEDELNVSLEHCFPRCEEWTEFMPYQVLSKISASLSAGTLVGSEICRNPLWLDISVNYTENLFRTVVILRLFPPWLHGALYWLLPSYWAGQRYLKFAKKLLVPKLSKLLQYDKDMEGQQPRAENDVNVLSWLAETTRGKDRNAQSLAHIEVLLALASVHTILLRMVNVLYDLTAHQSLIIELQREIEAQQHSQSGWNTSSYTELGKLDSVLRESQRMSPPTILGLKRIFKEDYTFSNGIHVSKGTYVSMPVYEIENDRENTPSPEKFDGLRAFKLRQELSKGKEVEACSQSAQSRLRTQLYGDSPYQFSSIDKVSLNFGYGKSACPGRHFASVALKITFVKLLTEYEFQFMPGQTRPANITAHEFLFCWPWQKMLIRRRKGGVCPF